LKIITENERMSKSLTGNKAIGTASKDFGRVHGAFTSGTRAVHERYIGGTLGVHQIWCEPNQL